MGSVSAEADNRFEVACDLCYVAVVDAFELARDGCMQPMSANG